MATTGSGRGPIKVGSGYIDVFPKMNQKALGELRAKMLKEMGKTGKLAGKEMGAGLAQGVTEASKGIAKEVKKVNKQIQKEAVDSKKVLKRIAAEVTRMYGDEAGKRFLQEQKNEKKKRKLVEETSAATRTALRTTIREEETAARTSAQRWQQAERQRVQLIREREREAIRAERAQAQAERQHEREQTRLRSQMRDQLAADRRARQADLRSQIDTGSRQMRVLRDQMQTYQRQINQTTRNTSSRLDTIQGKWRTHSRAISELGTATIEAGRLITTNLVAPLTAVATTLATIGIKSADMRMLGQLGLKSAGVSPAVSAQEMQQMQMYAINTPFSIDTMHEYQMKLIRSIASQDQGWYSKNPATRTNSANQAAGKTTDIIMAIGDQMARAGNLDPAMFERAMYAIDRMSDMGKAPTRNINQLVQATGIPAQELARMLGFKDANEFWKTVGTPVAKGGGVQSKDIINNLLRAWDPNYFKLDKNGKILTDKNGQAVINTGSSRKGGAVGFGEQMTNATITGRIQQMQERATYELGSLFAETDSKGNYQYTGLGEMLMGKRTPVMTRDNKGELTDTGKVTYEGGLLQDVQGLAGDNAGNVKKLLEEFLMGLKKAVEFVTWISDLVNDHPGFKKALGEFAKLAVMAAPFILALGLATKALGLMGKILGSAFTPFKKAFQGTRGAVRVGQQVASGISSRREGNGFMSGYRSRRDDIQSNGAQGNLDRAQRQARDLEQNLEELRRQLREVNNTNVSDVVNAIMGPRDSLNSATETATRTVQNAQQEVQQLNREHLNQVSNEATQTGSKFGELKSKVDRVIEMVKELDKQSLTGLRVELNTTEIRVNDVIDALGNGEGAKGLIGRIKNLNGRSLAELRKEFGRLNSGVINVHKSVGQGTGAQNLAGRVGLLNNRKLTSVIKQFKALEEAAKAAHRAIGTSNSNGLAGGVTDVNSLKEDKIKRQIEALKKALEEAKRQAAALEENLDDISSKTVKGGGSSGGSKKPKKKNRATGGVLPGYTPGRDVHSFYSPTAGQLDLSGGESVMRPEWTAVVGENTVNRLNYIARTQGVKGLQKMQFAKGGVIRPVLDFLDNLNVLPDATASMTTMGLHSRADGIGKGTGVQQGISNTGSGSSRWVGGDISNKLKGSYDFISDGMWDFIKKIPLPNGVSQVLGILGGTFAPILGDYAWQDIWKGRGNILERGSDFFGDVFSTNTLSKAFENLVGGTWDTAKNLWKTGTAFIKDPIGTAQGAFDVIWDSGKAWVNSIVDQISAIKDVVKSPLGYAKKVWDDTYATAKESLPTMAHLMDFTGNGWHSQAKPKIDQFLGGAGEPPGKGVERWRPVVLKILKELGLSQSYANLVLHRIQVESGGNPKAINNWDINAKNGVPSQGLMQTIPPTFNAYAGPYKKLGITSGMASIYAGLNYAIHRYGSRWPQALSGNKGYWTGTLSASPGLAMVAEKGPELVTRPGLRNFRGGERVYDAAETASLMAGGRPINMTINEAKSESTPQAVLRGFQWVDAMYGNRL